MEKTKIKLGNQFRAQFDSIVKMFEKKYVSSGVIASVSSDKNQIETDGGVFECNDGPDRAGGSSGEGRVAHIDRDGASWFSVLRGGEADTGIADWRKLIERIAADYHKIYSFLEYKMPEDDNALRAAQEAVAGKTFELLKKLFPNAGLSFFKPTDGQISDVYGLNLRLKIGSGMGETEPVLCQVFFIGKQTDENGELRPMGREAAKRVDMSVPEDDPAKNSDERVSKTSAISESFFDDSAENSDERVSSNVVEKVFAAFGELIKQDDNNDNSFSDYVLFDETDDKHIRELLNHLANSEVKTLECSDVNVLGISHLEWKSAVFLVSGEDDSERLRISIGLNNAVNVDCTNCSPQGVPLIQENVVLIDGDPIILKPEKDDMGLTGAVIKRIREKSAAASHLHLVSCGVPSDERPPEWLEAPCSNIVCNSQLCDYGNITKCANCPHPEIVYKDIFADGEAERLYTPSLAFAHDKSIRKLVRKDALGDCKYCGRSFMAFNLQNNVCPVCRGTEGGSAGKEKSKYSLYKSMLSPWKRLRYLFCKKKCAEDDDVVVFIMGSDRYVFNKDLITERGYIANPVKKKGN